MYPDLSRRSFLSAAAGAWAAGLAPAQTQRTNVLLILADDIGYECLGVNGSQSYKTPNLDRFAASGTRFEHGYAQPLCTPTRLQLMTGQYNFRNWVAFGLMHPKERGFGHMMTEGGYKTCIAGKWQFWSYDAKPSPRRGQGQAPEDSGFQEYSLWHAEHTEEKGSRYADPVIKENGRIRDDTKGKYGDDLFSDYIMRFMERNRNEPFFAYYPMALTHGPFNPTPKSKDWAKGNRLKNDPGYYADMVSYMDEVVGRVVQKVDDLGLAERTLILFYGDNGTPREITSRYQDRPYRGGKGLTTRAGMRVPLLARWNGTVPAARVTQELIDSTDFVPTLAEVTGVKKLKHAVDGHSFLPELRNQNKNPKNWLFSHYDPHPGCKVNFPATRLCWDRQWKLYRDGRLFNLEQDEDEKNPMKPGEGGAQAAEARKKLQPVLTRMDRQYPPRFNQYSAYGEAG